MRKFFSSKFHHATAFVVFGATGDLTQNKLYPALYHLSKHKMLPSKFYLYGLAREEMTNAEFKKQIEDDMKFHLGDDLDLAAVKRLVKNARYLKTDLNKREGYDKLEELIKADEVKIGHSIMRIFYLALPPSLFGQVVSNVQTCRLGKVLCTRESVLSRVIVEKPFGYNLASAKKLDKILSSAFREPQIYRIDHYLGKESFQNIFAFRFANPYFEGLWNNKHVSEIQINALETVGTEGRFAYYEGAGVLRDMVQSHLMQLLAAVTMDAPKSFTTAEIRKAKEKVIAVVRPFGGKVEMTRGQYRGYKKEKGVNPKSDTETSVSIKLEINNPRWKGIPIYIRTGKKLQRKETSVVVGFKRGSSIFEEATGSAPVKDQVSLMLSPSPSITMGMNVQAPGFELKTTRANLHYCRGNQLLKPEVGDYERLILDVIFGKQMLFTSSKEVLDSWKAMEPFLKASKKTKTKPYKPGSLGPKDGVDWLSIESSCKFEG